MNIGIFANSLRDLKLSAAHRLIDELERRGIGYNLCAVSEDKKPNAAEWKTFIENVDFIFTFGGDGTVLSAVRLAAPTDIPIIGVNLGHTGFLTEISPSEVTSALDKIIKGEYSIEQRAMLKITLSDNTYYALNDIVLSKGASTRPIKIDVELNDKFLDSYFSDGIIVSTPTGSTAYSLSAGGPLLAPDIEGIIIIPICVFSLHNRPIVVSDKHKITLHLAEKPATPVQIVVDGEAVDVKNFNDVLVEKSEYFASFVKINDKSFYDKLLHKLNYWGVTKVDKE